MTSNVIPAKLNIDVLAPVTIAPEVAPSNVQTLVLSVIPMFTVIDVAVVSVTLRALLK